MQHHPGEIGGAPRVTIATSASSSGSAAALAAGVNSNPHPFMTMTADGSSAGAHVGPAGVALSHSLNPHSFASPTTDMSHFGMGLPLNMGVPMPLGMPVPMPALPQMSQASSAAFGMHSPVAGPGHYGVLDHNGMAFQMGIPGFGLPSLGPQVSAASVSAAAAAAAAAAAVGMHDSPGIHTHHSPEVFGGFAPNGQLHMPNIPQQHLHLQQSISMIGGTPVAIDPSATTTNTGAMSAPAATTAGRKGGKRKSMAATEVSSVALAAAPAMVTAATAVSEQSLLDGSNTPTKPSKRQQVKNACINCQKACKKCDEGRPCQRCIRQGLTDTCIDSIRKERKRTVRRSTNQNAAQQTASTPVDTDSMLVANPATVAATVATFDLNAAGPTLASAPSSKKRKTSKAIGRPAVPVAPSALEVPSAITPEHMETTSRPSPYVPLSHQIGQTQAPSQPQFHMPTVPSMAPLGMAGTAAQHAFIPTTGTPFNPMQMHMQATTDIFGGIPATQQNLNSSADSGIAQRKSIIQSASPDPATIKHEPSSVPLQNQFTAGEILSAFMRQQHPASTQRDNSTVTTTEADKAAQQLLGSYHRGSIDANFLPTLLNYANTSGAHLNLPETLLGNKTTATVDVSTVTQPVVGQQPILPETSVANSATLQQVIKSEPPVPVVTSELPKQQQQQPQPQPQPQQQQQQQQSQPQHPQHSHQPAYHAPTNAQFQSGQYQLNSHNRHPSFGNLLGPQSLGYGATNGGDGIHGGHHSISTPTRNEFTYMSTGPTPTTSTYPAMTFGSSHPYYPNNHSHYGGNPAVYGSVAGGRHSRQHSAGSFLGGAGNTHISGGPTSSFLLNPGGTNGHYGHSRSVSSASSACSVSQVNSHQLHSHVASREPTAQNNAPAGNPEASTPTAAAHAATSAPSSTSSRPRHAGHTPSLAILSQVCAETLESQTRGRSNVNSASQPDNHEHSTTSSPRIASVMPPASDYTGCNGGSVNHSGSNEGNASGTSGPSSRFASRPSAFTPYQQQPNGHSSGQQQQQQHHHHHQNPAINGHGNGSIGGLAASAGSGSIYNRRRSHTVNSIGASIADLARLTANERTGPRPPQLPPIAAHSSAMVASTPTYPGFAGHYGYHLDNHIRPSASLPYHDRAPPTSRPHLPLPIPSARPHSRQPSGNILSAGHDTTSYPGPAAYTTVPTPLSGIARPTLPSIKTLQPLIRPLAHVPALTVGAAGRSAGPTPIASTMRLYTPLPTSVAESSSASRIALAPPTAAAAAHPPAPRSRLAALPMFDGGRRRSSSLSSLDRLPGNSSSTASRAKIIIQSRSQRLPEQSADVDDTVPSIDALSLDVPRLRPTIAPPLPPLPPSPPAAAASLTLPRTPAGKSHSRAQSTASVSSAAATVVAVMPSENSSTNGSQSAESAALSGESMDVDEEATSTATVTTSESDNVMQLVDDENDDNSHSPAAQNSAISSTTTAYSLA